MLALMETTMTAPRFLLAATLAATLLTLPVFATEGPCESALADSLIIAAGGPAAATARARQAGLAEATRPVLLNGARIYVPPVTPIVFTLAAPLVL